MYPFHCVNMEVQGAEPIPYAIMPIQCSKLSHTVQTLLWTCESWCDLFVTTACEMQCNQL